MTPKVNKRVNQLESALWKTKFPKCRRILKRFNFHLTPFTAMIQKQNSHSDFKQKTVFLPEDSQIPVSGDTTQRKAYEFYDLILMRIKTYSFIVDWQLPGIEELEVDLPHS